MNTSQSCWLILGGFNIVTVPQLWCTRPGNNILELVRIQNSGGEGAFRLIVNEDDPPEDTMSTKTIEVAKYLHNSLHKFLYISLAYFQFQ